MHSAVWFLLALSAILNVIQAQTPEVIQQSWQLSDGEQWSVYTDSFASICTVFKAEVFVVEMKCNGSKIAFPMKPDATLQRGLCKFNSSWLFIRNERYPLEVGFGFRHWSPPPGAVDRKNANKIFSVLDSVTLDANYSRLPNNNRTYCKESLKMTNLSSQRLMAAPIGNVHHCEDSQTAIELNENVTLLIYSLTIQTFRDSGKGNSTDLDDPEFACQAEVTRKRGFLIFVLIFLPVSLGGTYYFLQRRRKQQQQQTPTPTTNRRK